MFKTTINFTGCLILYLNEIVNRIKPYRKTQLVRSASQLLLIYAATPHNCYMEQIDGKKFIVANIYKLKFLNRTLAEHTLYICLSVCLYIEHMSGLVGGSVSIWRNISLLSPNNDICKINFVFKPLLFLWLSGTRERQQQHQYRWNRRASSTATKATGIGTPTKDIWKYGKIKYTYP